MKPILIFVVAFLVIGAGCRTETFSLTDEEATRLLKGSWSSSSKVTSAEEDITVVIAGQGTMTLSDNLTFRSEGDSEAVFKYPEGSAALRYRALVTGTWRVEESHLIFHRLNEEITPLDEITEAVLADKRMDQVRAEAPEETHLIIMSLTKNRFQAREAEFAGHLTGKRIKEPNNTRE